MISIFSSSYLSTSLQQKPTIYNERYTLKNTRMEHIIQANLM